MRGRIPRSSLANARVRIAAKVRDLRRSRKWTQAELARRLQLSQSRLSEIERGTGSFTAEQFLVLLKLFNVTASDFVSEPGEQELRIQNAVARLGARHLQESVRVLPSEQLQDVQAVLREAIVDGSPRLVTSLAPILSRNALKLNLVKLYAELERLGLERRLLWVVENTLRALELFHGESGPDRREWARIDQAAALVLQRLLKVMAPSGHDGAPRSPPPDILDTTIRSERTLEDVQRSSSKMSQRWGIVTSLRPEDFLQALKAARAGH
jgi:transcriptional regulator with XRE-family HTH domain